MELDAGLAEALWTLDQPRGRVDLEGMTRDTLVSIGRVPVARERVLALLRPADRTDLDACVAVVRPSLDAAEAYADVPGRDPRAG